MGPGAGSRQWDSPLAKYKLRVEEIAASGAPAVLAVHHYNTRAVSVLGYVAQFIPPPPNIKKIEMGAISRLLHLATSSLDFHSIFQLENACGLKIQCVLAVMTASMVRASVDTFQGIEDYTRYPREVASQCLPARDFVSSHRWPAGWDSLPGDARNQGKLANSQSSTLSRSNDRPGNWD